MFVETYRACASRSSSPRPPLSRSPESLNPRDAGRDPDVLLAALEHVLEDEPRELAALAHARAVSQEEAAARARREVLVVALAGVGDELELEVAEAALLDDLGPLLGELERVGDGRRRHRRERAVFHRVARVALHALDLDDAGRVGLVAHVLLDGLRLVALAARLLVVVVVVVVDGRRVREVDVLHAHVDVVALHLHELRLRVAVDLALRLAHVCCARVCLRGGAVGCTDSGWLFGGAARGGAGLSCGAESCAARKPCASLTGATPGSGSVTVRASRRGWCEIDLAFLSSGWPFPPQHATLKPG